MVAQQNLKSVMGAGNTRSPGKQNVTQQIYRKEQTAVHDDLKCQWPQLITKKIQANRLELKTRTNYMLSGFYTGSGDLNSGPYYWFYPLSHLWALKITCYSCMYFLSVLFLPLSAKNGNRAATHLQLTCPLIILLPPDLGSFPTYWALQLTGGIWWQKGGPRRKLYRAASAMKAGLRPLRQRIGLGTQWTSLGQWLQVSTEALCRQPWLKFQVQKMRTRIPETCLVWA